MISETVLRELQAIVGPDGLMDSPEDLFVYSYDASANASAVPDVVVQPFSTEEISAILKLASRHSIPVITRGSGTNLSGATIPVTGGIVLHLGRMNRILELDQENLTATVQPGVVTAELHAAVERLGLFYPPDPSSMRISTIGGNLALCAGGLRGLKYGVTKDYVLALEAVLPSGEVIRTGGKSVKDVAGYDLTKLLVGSEGTLGVITEATVKLIPLPEAKRTMLALYDNLAAAAATVTEILKNRILPATLEFMDDATIRCVEAYAHVGLPLDVKALLLIEVDGDEAVVARQAEQVAAICKQVGARDVSVAQTPAEGAKLLAARRSALAALARVRPTIILEDATVPRNKIVPMVEAIREIADKYNVFICTFGHAGDGNLHPTCCTDERDHDGFHRAEQAFDEIFLTALRLGGTITGEHGVGISKAKYLPLKVGEVGMELMRGIKQTFDPNNLLNPGKMFPNETRRRVVVRSGSDAAL